MNVSSFVKGALASAAAVAAVGVVIAQGTPPDPNAANPALGAGQRSTQGAPMGDTGTPAPTTTPGAASGSMGTPGAAGTTGATGATGAAGTGATGTMGATGATGTTGATGSDAARTDVDQRAAQMGAAGDRMRTDRN